MTEKIEYYLILMALIAVAGILIGWMVYDGTPQYSEENMSKELAWSANPIVIQDNRALIMDDLDTFSFEPRTFIFYTLNASDGHQKLEYHHWYSDTLYGIEYHNDINKGLWRDAEFNVTEINGISVLTINGIKLDRQGGDWGLAIIVGFMVVAIGTFCVELADRIHDDGWRGLIPHIRFRRNPMLCPICGGKEYHEHDMMHHLSYHAKKNGGVVTVTMTVPAGSDGRDLTYGRYGPLKNNLK